MTSKIAGQRFGRLVAIEPAAERRNCKVVWLCQCDCGARVFVVSTKLRNGHTQSCGCVRKGKKQSPEWIANRVHARRVNGTYKKDRPKKLCAVPGCDRPSHGKWCNMHRGRMANHGTVELLDRKPLAPKRYRQVKRPGHPLANPVTGIVYLHRAVLFDQMGSWGNVPCFWCGTTVRWSTAHPQPPDGLMVDHLDHDRHHNDSTNLVPSCNRCNCARSHWRTLPPLVSVYQRADGVSILG
jgi:hypothetical protein